MVSRMDCQFSAGSLQKSKNFPVYYQLQGSRIHQTFDAHRLCAECKRRPLHYVTHHVDAAVRGGDEEINAYSDHAGGYPWARLEGQHLGFSCIHCVVLPRTVNYCSIACWGAHQHKMAGHLASSGTTMRVGRDSHGRSALICDQNFN